LPQSSRGFATAFVTALLVVCILIFSITMNRTISVSAVETRGVGVYWDRNCSNNVTSIDWGTLSPGSVKDVTVYIRNEQKEPIYLILRKENWTPPEASEYLNLGWNYTSGRRMNLGETLHITLTLSVSRYIRGISSFSFDILVVGSVNFPGDVDKDGDCDADDVFSYFASAYGSKIGDPNYNPNCDFDGDGDVDPDDVFAYLAPYYGKNAQ